MREIPLLAPSKVEKRTINGSVLTGRRERVAEHEHLMLIELLQEVGSEVEMFRKIHVFAAQL